MEYKVQGQKGILIQLLPYPEEDTTTSSGIIIPKYKTQETDGGRFVAALDHEVYSLVGTVLQISDRAQQDLDEQKMDISVGDKVVIHHGAKSMHNWFIDPLVKVQDFSGQILATASSIQAKVNEA